MLLKKIYDKDNNVIENIVFKRQYDSGAFGCIYRMGNDKCLKIFLPDGIPNKEIIEKIMRLNLNNFYKIYDLVYDKNSHFIGYLMKYYQKENVDILTMPVDYTLDNFNMIYKSSQILSINNIVMNDLLEYNVILDKNNITVIDVDNYKYDHNAGYRNKFLVYALFKSLYIEALDNYYGRNNYCVNSMLDIFDGGYNGEFSLCKTLSKYKYPIDYMNSKIR